jgi:hypothetical protein
MRIIDQIIPLDTQNDLEKKVLDYRFPWAYIHSSDLSVDAKADYLDLKRKEFQNDHMIDPGQFFHNIFIDQQPGPVFQWFTPIIDAINFPGLRILRMKMNFNFPHLGANEFTHGIPHVDLPMEDHYTTAVYYVTDGDGDTLLFNEKNGHQGKLSIQGRVQPKKGRIVLFDGNTLHAACPPLSNKPRVVVNINIR